MTMTLAVPETIIGIEPLVQEFLEHLDRGTNTIRAYRSALGDFNRWLKTRGERERPADLVLTYKRSMEETGKAAATIGLHLSAIRSWGSYLVKTGRLSRNPAEDVRAPKQSKQHKRDALTLTEAVRLFDSIDTSTTRGLRDMAILSLMARAGLRDIEVVRANFEDIRTSNAQPVLWVHGKGRDQADEFVVLNTKAYEALMAYVATRGAMAEGDPLFVGFDGRSRGRLKTGQVSRLVAAALTKVGLKKATVTAHSLRHTAATLAVQAGVSLSGVQAMMRHADPRTTSRYVHMHQRLTQAAEFSLDF